MPQTSCSSAYHSHNYLLVWLTFSTRLGLSAGTLSGNPRAQPKAGTGGMLVEWHRLHSDLWHGGTQKMFSLPFPRLALAPTARTPPKKGFGFLPKSTELGQS